MFPSYSAVAAFVLCGLVLPIVLLNMLIAKIGDTVSGMGQDSQSCLELT
jgi:hypothetical protein